MELKVFTHVNRRLGKVAGGLKAIVSLPKARVRWDDEGSTSTTYLGKGA